MSQHSATDENATGLTPTTVSNQASIAEAMHAYRQRIRGGELGALPASLGLVVLVFFFSVLRRDSFFTVFNLANLLQQSAMVIVIAMGLVFVLLLGEIDLAAGFTAGATAAILGVTMTLHHWPWPLAVVATIFTGVVIGSTMGSLVAWLNIPSFVVTLSFFLGLQGVMLLVIGEGGTIPIRSLTIIKLETGNLSTTMGWVVAVVAVGGYAASTFLARRRRMAGGLPVQQMSVWLAKTGALAFLALLFTFMLNGERSQRPEIVSIKGVPVIVPFILVLLAVLTFILQRTAFGRHVYAVGGNAEAARRAGINVRAVRLACFVFGSVLASLAGILFASKDSSISPSTGGASTLLYAVGAAVIGGTSLFGGRGQVRDAILGGLVVSVIANGLPLITSLSGIQYVVTGLVLLLAASVDALSRRRSAAAGRA